MNIFTKDGRKFVQSRDGDVYRYWVVIISFVVTLVAIMILMGLGIALLIAGPEKSILATLLRMGVGFGVLYAGSKIGKIYVRILMRF